MVDLETLGTTASAVIMSVGAVKFDLTTNEIDETGFYASISIDSNLDLGRRIQEDTLMWWFKQDAAAQKVFNEPKVSLESALVDLSDWIGTTDYLVWSNGADFDIPMLAHAYSQIMVEVPWKPYSARCMRTYKNLPGADRVRIEKAGISHNALADAINQVRQLQAIHAALFGKKKVTA
ncbi:MAG: 3'-5' exoribonuclease [Proteobacteria bacterium]|nr:3'-5' exoribonuclease [Pseudomonadota bacterium]